MVVPLLVNDELPDDLSGWSIPLVERSFDLDSRDVLSADLDFEWLPDTSIFTLD
jgi:hypothetical protein